MSSLAASYTLVIRILKLCHVSMLECCLEMWKMQILELDSLQLLNNFKGKLKNKCIVNTLFPEILQNWIVLNVEIIFFKLNYL